MDRGNNEPEGFINASNIQPVVVLRDIRFEVHRQAPARKMASEVTDGKPASASPEFNPTIDLVFSEADVQGATGSSDNPPATVEPDAPIATDNVSGATEETTAIVAAETSLNVPPVASSSTPSAGGGSGHRSRKEKLICRSDADSIVVQTAVPLLENSSNMVIESTDNGFIDDIPPVKVKEFKPRKSLSPQKPVRPYNRKKSVLTDLKPETGESNTDPSVGDSSKPAVTVDKPKRPYKRRVPLQSRKGLHEKSLSPRRRVSAADGLSRGSPRKSPKKQPNLPVVNRITKYGRTVNTWETSLLPYLQQKPAPTSSVYPKSPVIGGSVVNLLEKQLAAADIRILGPMSSLPIFKPRQKPWKIIKKMLDSKHGAAEADMTSCKKPGETLRKEHSSAWFDVPVQESTEDGVEPLGILENDRQGEDTASSSGSEDEMACEPQILSDPQLPKLNMAEKLRVIPVPVEFKDGKYILPSDDVLKTYLERLKEAKKRQTTEPEQLDKAQRRSSSHSQSSGSMDVCQEKFVMENWATPKSRESDSSKKSSQEASSVTTQDSVGALQNNHGMDSRVPEAGRSPGFHRPHRISGSESHLFAPIQPPQSPSGSGIASRWSFNGRESPSTTFGGHNGLPFNRFQPPSPSPSSVSNSSNSGRRYSRRRHSRMYPPFETSHCMYSKHFCPAPLEPGSTYCKRHITDKSSPYYVRCAFVSCKTGKRCWNMQFSRDGKQKFCSLHASRLALVRQKLHRKPASTSNPVEHATSMRRILTKLKSTNKTELAEYVDNFCDYKLSTQCLEGEIPSAEAVENQPLVEEYCKFQPDAESDVDCEAGDEYDCLKKAGYYSTEEVVRILKSKLKSLKELYAKEFDFLKMYYLIKRQEYLANEKGLSDIKVSRNPKTLLRMKHLVTDEFIRKEFRSASKTKSLLSYHRSKGQATVLHHIAKQKYEERKRQEAAKQDVDDDSDSIIGRNPIVNEFMEKSAATAYIHQKSNAPTRCKFYKDYVRCENSSLPSCDYCFSHVAADQRQRLFQSCCHSLPDQRRCPSNGLKKLFKDGCDLHKIFRLRRFKKSKGEKRLRQNLWRSVPVSSNEETLGMLEQLVVSRFTTVEEFDREIQDILAKGIDANEPSDSDMDDCEYEEIKDGPASSAPLPTSPRIRGSRLDLGPRPERISRVEGNSRLDHRPRTERRSHVERNPRLERRYSEKKYFTGPKRPVGRPPKAFSLRSTSLQENHLSPSVTAIPEMMPQVNGIVDTPSPLQQPVEQPVDVSAPELRSSNLIPDFTEVPEVVSALEEFLQSVDSEKTINEVASEIANIEQPPEVLSTPDESRLDVELPVEPPTETTTTEESLKENST